MESMVKLMTVDLDFYKNKKIFITGHTGFKGSWLCLFLKILGANITGYSLAPGNNCENLFELAKIGKKMDSYIADIRDYEKLKKVLQNSKPDIVFHLAAQPLVRDSYNRPLYNYETNVMGTVNLFEASKRLDSLGAFVNITTDKCYENKEWFWPYRENDSLGGHDPYSASKACSEIVTNSYRKSFFEGLSVGVASARAGNVIGGGDFSIDRIIPDVIRSIKLDQKVVLRNPKAIRPWQHVLDVLSGYLLLGKSLYSNPKKFSESFNFSPFESRDVTVEELTKHFIYSVGKGSYKIGTTEINLHESKMLKLDSNKAHSKLGWSPKFKISEAVSKTAFWYKCYFDELDINSLCLNEINNFIKL